MPDAKQSYPETCPHDHVIDKVREEVGEIRTAVFGEEGRMNTGIQYRVERLDERAAAAIRVLWAILIVIISFVIMRVAEKVFPSEQEQRTNERQSE